MDLDSHKSGKASLFTDCCYIVVKGDDSWISRTMLMALVRSDRTHSPPVRYAVLPWIIVDSMFWHLNDLLVSQTLLPRSLQPVCIGNSALSQQALRVTSRVERTALFTPS